MTLALLCPGQGAQHAGMFARVAGQADAAALLAQASAVLGEDVQALAGDPRRFDNAIAQPLVCLATLSYWAALKPRLPIAPSLVLGYSVGELAAHAIAGSFDARQCLALAQRRGALMDEASPADAGLMAVTGLAVGTVTEMGRAHKVLPAIVNGDDHLVLGGLRTGLIALQGEVEARGARTVLLPVHVPSHTPLLKQAAAEFERVLSTLPPQRPALRVLAGIDGRMVDTARQVTQTLSAQISQTLQWHQVMQQALERGARVFLELGPGAALSKMAREIAPDCQARSVEEFKSLQGVADWVSAAQARMS
ncbi:MAG: malonate decarboxylase subunit epsilon [Pseudoxanthomonas sp.]